MVESMITVCSRSTSPQHAHMSDSHTHTYRIKTVMHNACYALLTTWFVQNACYALSTTFHASAPLVYSVEALHTATHLLNILPSTAINNDAPYNRCSRRHQHISTYERLNAYAIWISYPWQNISWPDVQHHVSSLGTLQIIENINALTSPLNGSYSLATSSLLNRYSLSPTLLLNLIPDLLHYFFLSYYLSYTKCYCTTCVSSASISFSTSVTSSSFSTSITTNASCSTSSSSNHPFYGNSS